MGIFSFILAIRTNSLLLFICGKFLPFGKSAYIQILFFARKHIFINAALVGHVVVHKQGGYTLFKLLCVVSFFVIKVVKFTPIYALHFSAIFGKSEYYPIYNVLKVNP